MRTKMSVQTKRMMGAMASAVLSSAIGFAAHAQAQAPSDTSLEVTIRLLPENAVGPEEITRRIELPPLPVAPAERQDAAPNERRTAPPGAERGPDAERGADSQRGPAAERGPDADERRGRGQDIARDARERGRDVSRDVEQEARDNRENAGRSDERGPPRGRPDDAGPPGESGRQNGDVAEE